MILLMTWRQSAAAQDLRNRGANIVKGDLDDPNSLQHAVKDVESLFLMGTTYCPYIKLVLSLTTAAGWR
jgi:hypothetical protein